VQLQLPPYDQGWQDAYNAAKESNPSADIEYLLGALYYKGWLWIPPNDDLPKMKCEVEHDTQVASLYGSVQNYRNHKA
jgi:hypothetical protein